MPDLEVRGDQKLDLAVGQPVGLGQGGNPLAFGLRADAILAEIALEVQPAQQKGQRRAHVVGFLELHLLGAIGVRAVEVDILAVGNEQLAGRAGIHPAHAARLAQEQLSGFGPASPRGRRVALFEQDLKGLGAVVPAFDAAEQSAKIDLSRHRQSRQRQQRQGSGTQSVCTHTCYPKGNSICDAFPNHPF
ncbi:MAG: hypothetical protein HY822_16725 [Acidobacteria bacterium]|nr:hypothetical protein [Acidobacteriota bacterium]